MSISDTDIVWRKAATNNDTSSNGGRMTFIAIPNGVKNSIWPDVPQAERAAGSTKYRKVFIAVANDDDLAMIRPRVFVETPTPGDDSVVIFPGTFTDTQTAASAYAGQVYGCGFLFADVGSGATSLTVQTEGASLGIFSPGMIIRVSDKTSVDDPAGHEEYVTIATAGVSYAGDIATLTLTAGLQHSYLSSVTKVASVYELASLKGTFENFSVTSGAGTYNSITNPVEVDSIGGVYQNWTLTFTTTTSFTVTGDDPAISAMLSGSTFSRSADAMPINTANGKPFFILRAAGFGGSFVAGNTISFRTSPPAIPIWYKRIIPAGASSLSGNRVVVGIDGEST